MSQHYTRDTVEVSEWCKKCRKNTMHRVDGTRLGPCLECLEKLKKAKPAPPKPLEGHQLDLFGGEE